MTVIGVTGGIGSGKTTVTDFFAENGITVVDADLVAREAVAVGSQALRKIAEHFGEGILLANGELDRATLRQIVFNDNNERLWLEGVTHPEIRRLIIAKLKEACRPYCILSSPLLFETKQTELVDRVLVVDLPYTLQLERAAGRDGKTVTDIKKIASKQLSREARLEFADDILDNSISIEATRKQVAEFHQAYLKLSSV